MLRPVASLLLMLVLLVGAMPAASAQEDGFAIPQLPAEVAGPAADGTEPPDPSGLDGAQGGESSAASRPVEPAESPSFVDSVREAFGSLAGAIRDLFGFGGDEPAAPA